MPKLVKTDSYRAVYAPDYEPDSDNNLVLKEGKQLSTSEYLECSGTRPIDIYFERSYSRMRIYSPESKDIVEITVGKGFKTNNGEVFESDKEYKFVPDANGNSYLYGLWDEGVSITMLSKYVDDENPGVSISSMLTREIDSASKPDHSYAVTTPTEVGEGALLTLDLSKGTITDWTKYEKMGVTGLKVIGAWNEEQKPTISVYFTTVDLSEVTGMTSVPDSYFRDRGILTHVDLPNSITSIGNNAFNGARSLVMPELPSSVESIGDYAFYCCQSLAIESLPSSLKTLGSNAFRSSYVKLSTLPSGITSLGQDVLQGCTFDSNVLFEWPSASDDNTCFTSMPYETFDSTNGLTAVVIPADVTSLSDYVFWWSRDLETVICRAATAPSLGYSVFRSIKSDAVLYVPTGSSDSYSSAWSSYFGGGVQELTDEEMDAKITELRNRFAESE
jgi:hypothetical protein